jgi:hypothetical protein
MNRKAARPAGDFDLGALFAALDSERSARGLTWTAAVRALSAPFTSGGSRPIAVSTVKSVAEKPVAEGDGVLQMLRWLGRSPESFIRGGARAGTDQPLPAVPAGRMLRFDTRALHAALNQRRLDGGLTWPDIAREIPGVSVNSLQHLAAGGRTGFPHVVRLTQWLGRPVADFTRQTSR